MSLLAAPSHLATRDGTPVGTPPRRLLWVAGIIALLAVALGVFMYPDTQRELMPLWQAATILGLAAGGVVVSGRPRLVILLPLIASYLPSLEAGFVALVVTLLYFVIDYGGARWARPLDRVDWALLAVWGWTVLAWLANLGDQTDLWALPVFFLTFLSPWALLFFARAVTWTREDLRLILGVWVVLTVAQIGPALVKPAVIGLPEAYAQPLEIFDLSGVSILVNIARGGGDSVTGTMVSAHHLGVVLLLVGVYVVSLRRLVVPRGWAVVVFVVAYVFFMTSAKHVLLAAIPAGAIYVWRTVWTRLRPRTRSALVVASLATAFLGARPVAAYVQRTVIEGVWRAAFVFMSLNPKVQLYSRTVARLTPGSAAAWIGYGPGAYASRAASIRATDVLYKENARLPGLISAHAGPAYREVMYDLYTSQIVETVSSRSGVLTNPFSSVVGIVGEYGIIGTVLLLVFLSTVAGAGFRCWRHSELAPEWRAIGATAGFAIPLLVGLGFFDSYFEQPDVMAPLVTVMFLALVACQPSLGGRAEGVPPSWRAALSVSRG